MEREPPPPVFQLMQCMYHATFCIKQRQQVPRGELGGYLFIYMIGFAYEFLFFRLARVRSAGPGARRLDL
jgi:tryptophan-rich sensory protein